MRLKQFKINTMKSNKAEGLGDTIEQITKVTGIKKMVETVKKGKCTPCEERRKKLNEKYPYKK